MSILSPFGRTKIIKRSSLRDKMPVVHPHFLGIYACYQELFKGLSYPLEKFSEDKYLPLWQCADDASFYIITQAYSFHHITENQVNFLVRTYPTSYESLQRLHDYCSQEFIAYMSKERFDVNLIHPSKLLMLINQNLSKKILLECHQSLSKKPHYAMSMNVLSKLLRTSPYHLQKRINDINKERQRIIETLCQSSHVANKAINDPNFTIKPADIWTLI